jgi:CubicO group peptidase (beta-lactamase class C family)
MQAFVDKGQVPGAVTLVSKKDRIVSFEAVGYRDLESKTPMTVDTIFDIRSSTEPAKRAAA